ncbi:MAG: hypothetical protein HC842_01785 [Cytophagales bacterium]|nr:hypothetical protein [Cytophagales bacterium]
MKNLYIVGTVLLLSLGTVGSAAAQCNSDAHTDACLGKLREGFTFLKSFKIDGQGGAKPKVEYSYVFSKDTQYFINICADGAETDGIEVTLYDSNRKKMTSNFVNGKFFPGIVYPCNATGIYYITFTFQGSTHHCGGSVLGFKR